MIISGCDNATPDTRRNTTTGNTMSGNTTSATTGLFDIEVGKKFPIKPIFESSDETPSVEYGFRAPIPPNSSIDFLVDFDVFVNKENNNVSFITAKRAFTEPNECSNALDALSKIAKDKYSLNIIHDEAKARFVADSGDQLIEINCYIPSGSPYHELLFILSSKSQAELRKIQWDAKVLEMQKNTKAN